MSIVLRLISCYVVVVKNQIPLPKNQYSELLDAETPPSDESTRSRSRTVKGQQSAVEGLLALKVTTPINPAALTHSSSGPSLATLQGRLDTILKENASLKKDNELQAQTLKLQRTQLQSELDDSKKDSAEAREEIERLAAELVTKPLPGEVIYSLDSLFRR
jgi:hypothetical protein